MLRRSTRVFKPFRFNRSFRRENIRQFCEQQKEIPPQVEERTSIFRNVFWVLPAICFGLSYWQYKRLFWKRDLISDLEHRFTSKTEEFPNELVS